MKREIALDYSIFKHPGSVKTIVIEKAVFLQGLLDERNFSKM